MSDKKNAYLFRTLDFIYLHNIRSKEKKERGKVDFTNKCGITVLKIISNKGKDAKSDLLTAKKYAKVN